MESLDRFVSAQQLHEIIRGGGDNIGLATVYRNLQILAEDGEVDTLRDDQGEMLYRMCGHAHHHHLVCRRCGLTVEVAGQDVEQWAQKIAKENSFAQVDHTIELFGLCADCSS